MKWGIAALAAFLVLVMSVADADARRSLGHQQKRAVLRDEFADLGLRAPPVRCDPLFNVYRSTVDRRWAMDASDGRRHVDGCLRWTGQGLSFLHLTDFGWHVVIEVPNDFECPLTRRSARLPHVPWNVERDLARCRK